MAGGSATSAAAARSLARQAAVRAAAAVSGVEAPLGAGAVVAGAEAGVVGGEEVVGGAAGAVAGGVEAAGVEPAGVEPGGVDGGSVDGGVGDGGGGEVVPGRDGAVVDGEPSVGPVVSLVSPVAGTVVEPPSGRPCAGASVVAVGPVLDVGPVDVDLLDEVVVAVVDDVGPRRGRAASPSSPPHAAAAIKVARAVVAAIKR